MKKIVITGGPHSGKTALINYLNQTMGEEIVTEAAKAVIMTINRIHGKKYVTELRLNAKQTFQELIMNKQLALESKIEGTTGRVYMDRSILDCIAYCRFEGIIPTGWLLKQAEEARFHKVFMLDMILPYNTKGRMTDSTSSQTIRLHLEQVYSEYGHRFKTIPQLPVEERARIVMTE